MIFKLANIILRIDKARPCIPSFTIVCSPVMPYMVTIFIHFISMETLTF